MIAVPAVTPVTVPPVTDALDELLLHAPPDVPSVKDILEPAQTDVEPDKVPALVNGFTVTF